MSTTSLQDINFDIEQSNCESIFEHISDAIFVLPIRSDEETILPDKLSYVNSSVSRLSQCSKQELLELNPLTIIKTFPEHLLNTKLQDCLRGAVVQFDGMLCCKNDHKIPLSIKLIKKSSFIIVIAQEVQSLQIGKRQNQIDTDKIPDFTEKMTTLSTLVSGIAHEINNPNNIISLSSDVLRELWDDIWPIIESRYDADSTFSIRGQEKELFNLSILNLISNILSGSQRISKTIDSIKEITHLDVNERKTTCSIVSIVNSALLATSNISNEHPADFLVCSEENLPLVMGAPNLLRHAIINVLTNAVQALTEENQKIYITLGLDISKNAVVICIRDEGEGIPSENLNFLFDPFFTTRRESGHLGLGLTLTYSIIKKHKGNIEFSSKENYGTTVIIKIPL